jgi:hypothetical protein
MTTPTGAPSSLHIHVTCEAQRLSSSVASFLIHQGHLKPDPQDQAKGGCPLIQFSCSGWHASTAAVEEVLDHPSAEGTSTAGSKKPKPKGKGAAAKKAGAASSSATEGGGDSHSNLASPALGPSDTNGSHTISAAGRFPRISFAEAEYLCRSGADAAVAPSEPFDVVVCLTQSAFNTILDFYTLSPSSATVTQQRWPSDSTSIGRRRNILLLHISDPTTLSNLKGEIDRESAQTTFNSKWVLPYSAASSVSPAVEADSVASGVQRLSLLYGQFLRSVLQEWRDHPALLPSLTADDRVLLLGQLVANSASQYEKLKGVQLLYHLQVE